MVVCNSTQFKKCDDYIFSNVCRCINEKNTDRLRDSRFIIYFLDFFAKVRLQSKTLHKTLDHHSNFLC